MRTMEDTPQSGAGYPSMKVSRPRCYSIYTVPTFVCMQVAGVTTEAQRSEMQCTVLKHMRSPTTVALEPVYLQSPCTELKNHLVGLEGYCIKFANMSLSQDETDSVRKANPTQRCIRMC